MTVKILKEDVKRFLSVIEDMYSIDNEEIIEVMKYNEGFVLQYKDVVKKIKVEGLNDIRFNITIYQLYQMFTSFYGEEFIKFKLEEDKDGKIKLKYKNTTITVEKNVIWYDMPYHDIFFIINWFELTKLLKTCDTFKFTREGFGEKETYYIRFKPEDRERIIKFISVETGDNKIKIKVESKHRYLFIRTDKTALNVKAEEVELENEEE